MTTPRVLVVDDNALNLELVGFVLESADFVLLCRSDAEAARAALDTFRPDLILMDIQLPGLDGVTFTRQLKSDPRYQHMVIVAFTAYAMKGDEAKFRAAGCDGYISKPIDVSRFADQLRQLLSAGPDPVGA